MTMQVGMVGTDGILIAGDTRWMKEPRLENRFWLGGRTTFNSPKIKIDHERGMAISCARDMEIALQVATEVASKLSDADISSPVAAIETIAAGVLSRSKEKLPAQCLIAFTKPFQFATVNGEWAPLCQPMETIAIAGDNVNPSIFWAERYYEKRPIERLVPLAAHLVVCAHKLNTATISGLEIVLCDASGCHRLSDDSIRELELKVEEWDRSIGDLFLNHRQQFTYAPNVIG